MKNDQVLKRKLQRHKDFWNRINDSPLIGYSFGNYFVSKRFKAAEGLLGINRYVIADDFNVRRIHNCPDWNIWLSDKAEKDSMNCQSQDLMKRAKSD